LTVTPTEPLPLHHSWPLTDVAQRFDLGHLLDVDDGGAAGVSIRPDVARPDAICGAWACDLADDRLHWSAPVYRLFGLPEGEAPARCRTVALYAEASRAAMERLRRHAIRHRRGFTLDVAIVPHDAGRRWIRLVAAPVCVDGVAVRLHGCKADVSHLYR
jgi:PAS domain-containing protein